MVLFAMVPLLAHAWGAPLGEPAAEDFDFLHRVVFSHGGTLLDGGGSQAFWRPLAQQIYYGALGRVMLSHPGMVAAIHALFLALAAWLIYRALRPVWPGPWAVVAATFPLLAESSRQLVDWPGHFADVGVWLFTAIAVHELSGRRLGPMLAALLAALLCKEVAIVAVLALPWLPNVGPAEARRRFRWALATAALGAAWALVYWWVRMRAHLALPHGLEQGGASASATTRFAWAIRNSARALFSLPAATTAWEGWIIAALVLLALVMLGMAFWSVPVRDRLRRSLPVAAWGFLWFVAVATTFTVIHPFWAPNRALYAGLGLGIAYAAVLGPLGGAALAGFTALRLAAFALSPGPPPNVSLSPPESGAFIDFPRLVRLQRMVSDTREALKQRWPTLPHGSAICHYFLPPLTEYAFGQSKALQIWYADTTLRWIRYEDFEAARDRRVITFIEYQPDAPRQISFVEPDAMRHFLVAVDAFAADRPAQALPELGRADSLQRGSDAVLFPSYVAGERAACLWALDRRAEAVAEARRSLALYPGSPEARNVMELADSIADASEASEVSRRSGSPRP